MWKDPDFHADERAFYYARVLENPTCRWSQRLCVEAKPMEAKGEGFSSSPMDYREDKEAGGAEDPKRIEGP